MNKPLPDTQIPPKPSGSITYTVNTGVNVFPGMTDKAFVRVLDGKLVVFQAFRPDQTVAVSIGGQDRVLPRSEWRALPVYDGKLF